MSAVPCEYTFAGSVVSLNLILNAALIVIMKNILKEKFKNITDKINLIVPALQFLIIT